MKIGLVSTYLERCGVSSYTQNLVEGLQVKGVDVKVAANYKSGSNVGEDKPYIGRFFHTPFLTKKETADIEGFTNFMSDCDVIHFQFELNIFHPSYFPSLINSLRKLHKPFVFTFHSSGMWPDFNTFFINSIITHEEVGFETDVIPMGVNFQESLPKVPEHGYKAVTSFGLGRNADPWLLKAIRDLDLRYNTHYGHHNWLSSSSLLETVNRYWIISLLYPDVGANVSSSAIMMAMALDRPILITNTNWFRHVVNYPGLYICRDEDDVKSNIDYLINNIDKVYEDINLRKQRLTEDKRTYEDFINSHIKIYERLINETKR